MAKSTQSRGNIFSGDISQDNVYNISQSGSFSVGVDKAKNNVAIDSEVANLLNWLAQEQGISPEIALKKAVATAAYIYEVTTSQGGKLLVRRRDNSVGEIVLK